MTIIFASAALLLVPSVSFGSTQRVGFIHDVKVFHVTGAGSRPAPAVLTMLVGGKGIGKLVTGRNGHGKRFTIAGVIGGKAAQIRQTGTDGRLTLDVAQVCRNNPTSRYFIRAAAVINGRHRTAWIQGDCGWVIQVLEHDSMSVNHTTFFFDGQRFQGYGANAEHSPTLAQPMLRSTALGRESNLLVQARVVFHSPNGLVITTRQVMYQKWPILLVSHDGEDPEGWQFVNGHGDTDDPSDGIPVHPEHVIEHDPSVAELADLPAGWRAWRESTAARWVREPGPS